MGKVVYPIFYPSSGEPVICDSHVSKTSIYCWTTGKVAVPLTLVLSGVFSAPVFNVPPGCTTLCHSLANRPGDTPTECLKSCPTTATCSSVMGKTLKEEYMPDPSILHAVHPLLCADLCVTDNIYNEKKCMDKCQGTWCQKFSGLPVPVTDAPPKGLPPWNIGIIAMAVVLTALVCSWCFIKPCWRRLSCTRTAITFQGMYLRDKEEGEDRSEGQPKEGQPKRKNGKTTDREQETRGERAGQAQETEGNDRQTDECLQLLLPQRAEDSPNGAVRNQAGGERGAEERVELLRALDEDIGAGRREEGIGVDSERVDRNGNDEVNEDGVSVTDDWEQGESGNMVSGNIEDNVGVMEDDNRTNEHLEDELNYIEEGGQGIEAGNDEENLDERTVQSANNNEESTIEAEESDDRLGLVGNVDDGNAEGRSDQQSPVIIGNGEENIGGNESSGEGYDVESVQNEEVEGRVESEERAAAPAGDEEEEVGDREGGYEGDEDTTVEEEGMSDRNTSNEEIDQAEDTNAGNEEMSDRNRSNEGINQAEDRNEGNEVTSDRNTSVEEIDQAEYMHEGDEEMSDGTSSDEEIDQAEYMHEGDEEMSDGTSSDEGINQAEGMNEGDEELGHDASSSLDEDVGAVPEIRDGERIANEDENSGVWVRGLEDQVRPVARVRPVPVVDDLRRPEEANNSDQGVFVASGR